MVGTSGKTSQGRCYLKEKLNNKRRFRALKRKRQKIFWTEGDEVENGIRWGGLKGLRVGLQSRIT